MFRFVCTALVLAAAMVGAEAGENGREAWREYEKAGIRAYYDGKLSEAIFELEAAVQEAGAAGISLPDLRILNTVRFLAKAYRQTGQSDKALTMYTHLLVLQEDLDGPDAPAVEEIRKEIQSLLRP